MGFFESPNVHSGPGDGIKAEYRARRPEFQKSCAERRHLLRAPDHLQRGVSLFHPISSVPVTALVGWMLLLTFKHIIADFVLQSSWMAIGKDQKTGWALPLLAHCL